MAVGLRKEVKKGYRGISKESKVFMPVFRLRRRQE